MQLMNYQTPKKQNHEKDNIKTQKNMKKKYKLTEKFIINPQGVKLFQIQAIISFGAILKGELGGYIAKEDNLARVSGNAWVYDSAQVSGNAWVSGNAQVYGKLKILAGYFFGMRCHKEEIKFKENEGQEIIYKGDAKFEE